MWNRTGLILKKENAPLPAADSNKRWRVAGNRFNTWWSDDRLYARFVQVCLVCFALFGDDHCLLVLLQEQPIIDLLILAWFYTQRVVLGGAAVDVEISPWLYGFSIFFFMSLAMLKRFADLMELEKFGQTEAKGRSYNSNDLPLFRSMGPATACTSVFVLAMYISTDVNAELYKHPRALWFICPVLFYWIMRVWFIANRGDLHYDPIVFALRDKISHIVALVVGLIIVLASIELPWH